VREHDCRTKTRGIVMTAYWRFLLFSEALLRRVLVAQDIVCTERIPLSHILFTGIVDDQWIYDVA
jgi:hypothetical protein